MTESRHFSLDKVSEGIYAAIAKDGGGAVGNAGFIDLGDKTIVFDTFNTQQAAEDLKSIAEEVTGQPVTWVVNSHWHGDHIRGNQIFKKCNIVSSDTTFTKMREVHPERIKKQRDDIAGLKGYIKSLEDKGDKAPDTQLKFLKEIAVSLPTLALTLPNCTFKKEFTILGSKRTAKIMTFGGGHSNCDAILYIPEEKVAFMGDLLFVNSHPTFFEESNPVEWYNILNEVENFDFEMAIPGHGEVGTKQDIAKVKEYINDLLTLARVEDSIEEIQIPEKYKEWKAPEVFKQNLKILKGK